MTNGQIRGEGPKLILPFWREEAAKEIPALGWTPEPDLLSIAARSRFAEAAQRKPHAALFHGEDEEVGGPVILQLDPAAVFLRIGHAIPALVFFREDGSNREAIRR